MQFLSRNDRLSRNPCREHALLRRRPGSRFRLHRLRCRRERVTFEFRQPGGFWAMPVPDVRALHRGLPTIRVTRVRGMRFTTETLHRLDAIPSTLQWDDAPAGRPLGDQFVAMIRRPKPREGVLAAREQQDGSKQREEAKGVHGAEDGKRRSQAQAASRPTSVFYISLR